MKKIIFCFLLVTSITQIAAQPMKRAPRGEGDLQGFQAKLILHQLDIEESKQAEFKEIYSAYSAEIKALRPDAPERGEVEKLSDEVIEEQILRSFEMSEKTTAIKKEYYEKFKAILTPRQILKMYNIERHIADRAHSEMENRGKGNPHGGVEPPRD